VAIHLGEPTEEERKAIAQAAARRAKRAPRVAVSLTQTGPKTAQSGPNHADAKGWCDRILDALGTTSADFLTTELGRIMNAVGATGEDGEARTNAALAVLDGLKPRNEIEAMLGSQMAVTHALAMEVLGRARRVQDIGQFDSAANAAGKLLRTYLLQMEALAALRRGGKQEVRVVHVHAGGQWNTVAERKRHNLGALAHIGEYG
jgi:hypothetical protein